jgi:hypothetical protein
MGTIASSPGPTPRVATPRICGRAVKVAWANTRPGVTKVRSRLPVMPALAIESAVSAVTATGVSCRRSERFCAVTTISSRPTVSAAAGLVWASAAAGAATIAAHAMRYSLNSDMFYIIPLIS